MRVCNSTAHLTAPRLYASYLPAPFSCLLQVVVDALYRGAGGHECLRETVRAIVAGVRNPTHLELSISAVQLLLRSGARLAEWEDAGHKDPEPVSSRPSTAGNSVDLGG